MVVDDKSFIVWGRGLLDKYPDMREEIGRLLQDAYELALSEIDEGGCPMHEFEIAQDYVNDEIIDMVG